MATGWRVVELPGYEPGKGFRDLDDVATPPGAVSEPFWVLSPGRRWCAHQCCFRTPEHVGVVEVAYDAGDVLESRPWKLEPIRGHLEPDGMGGWEGTGTPNPPAEYTLVRIAAGTVAVDLEASPGGGAGSLHDFATVALAPEGTP